MEYIYRKFVFKYLSRLNGFCETSTVQLNSSLFCQAWKRSTSLEESLSCTIKETFWENWFSSANRTSGSQVSASSAMEVWSKKDGSRNMVRLQITANFEIHSLSFWPDITLVGSIFLSAFGTSANVMHSLSIRWLSGHSGDLLWQFWRGNQPADRQSSGQEEPPGQPLQDSPLVPAVQSGIQNQLSHQHLQRGRRHGREHRPAWPSPLEGEV